ncbi:MAG: helix-turn-helix transcriptional regulator [Acidimicrobiales bacterium]
MKTGRLLQELRRRHGLTQAELAARAGTSQPVISAYEHGRRDPTLKTLGKLVEAGGERLFIDAQVSSLGSSSCEDVEEQARRLADVLTLADAIPTRRRSPTLVAPRMVSR